MKAMREPTRNGGSVFHSTALMFSYQSGALSGFDANPATSALLRPMVICVSTSTAIASLSTKLCHPECNEGPGWDVARSSSIAPPLTQVPRYARDDSKTFSMPGNQTRHDVSQALGPRCRKGPGHWLPHDMQLPALLQDSMTASSAPLATEADRDSS